MFKFILDKVIAILDDIAFEIMEFRPKYFGQTEELRRKWNNLTFDIKWKIVHRFIPSIIARIQSIHTVFVVKQVVSIPADSNPFHYDLQNMGTTIGSNLIVMYGNQPDEICTYLILVDLTSGQRVEITFNNIEVDTQNNNIEVDTQK